MTSAILLVAEFCEPAERHIVSIFKIIQELLAPSGVKGKTLFHLLMDSLPSDHKARWFAGAALSSSEQAMASVMSTALARLHIRHIREKIEDSYLYEGNGKSPVGRLRTQEKAVVGKPEVSGRSGDTPK